MRQLAAKATELKLKQAASLHLNTHTDTQA